MLSETDARARGLADLPEVQSDSLLQLIALCNADPRPEKIDVGVGVFRDGHGNTPILKVIKEAERILLETQETKSYLGSAGDKRFAELLRPVLLGEHADKERIAGLLRRAPPRLRADRNGQSERPDFGRNPDLAESCTDHPRRWPADDRISLLRP
jgi:hypothetical protein